MKYKDYISKVEFDDQAGIFHGEIINTRDVITFQGKTVNELRKAMKESIDDYLGFCKERNEEPDKPFSGKFTIRIDPELHRKIFQQARLSNKSLNLLVKEALESLAHSAPSNKYSTLK